MHKEQRQLPFTSADGWHCFEVGNRPLIVPPPSQRLNLTGAAIIDFRVSTFVQAGPIA
jgi:hypothetical protein